MAATMTSAGTRSGEVVPGEVLDRARAISARRWRPLFIAGAILLAAGLLGGAGPATPGPLEILGWASGGLAALMFGLVPHPGIRAERATRILALVAGGVLLLCVLVTILA